MTGPDDPNDTLPPESGVTLPSPPPSSSTGNLPIPMGDAEFAVSQAMTRLVDAVVDLQSKIDVVKGAAIGVERTSMAIARQMDSTVKEPT